MIGAGATVLGNIEIGQGARIGAGSVVLAPVASDRTVVKHGDLSRMTNLTLSPPELERLGSAATPIP
jgi:serine acetyltransferase